MGTALKFKMKELYQKLINYDKKDYYPFHMPGHKRNPFFLEKNLPWNLDITEIEGFDNLHHPEGVIKRAQERASSLYGTKASFFSVNGSTAALLTAISAAVKPGGKILIARNCHKAVYHGIYLRGLRPVYLQPGFFQKWGINGGISPSEVEEKLKSEPDIEAVLITSPTYDGMVSDIGKISDAAHKYGIPLIVDEAHGAHFPFSDFFPDSAVNKGADLVIQSLHKTLPSLTQTALLHQCTLRVPQEDLQRFMGIYQSSSPSYILMAGIDWCMDFLEKESQNYFKPYVSELRKLRESLKDLKNLCLFDERAAGRENVWDMDLTKLILCVNHEELNGHILSSLLRRDYHLEMEMEAENYVLGISSVCDRPEGLSRLKTALEEIDRNYEENSGRKKRKEIVIDKKSPMFPVQRMKIFDAAEGRNERIRISESEGRISAEFIYLYPPGIPLVVPGEEISKELIECLDRYKKEGFEIQGMSDINGEWIRIVG